VLPGTKQPRTYGIVAVDAVYQARSGTGSPELEFYVAGEIAEITVGLLFGCGEEMRSGR
jgi:hypothetical protein